MISIVSNMFSQIERIDIYEFEKDFLFIVNGKLYLLNIFDVLTFRKIITKNEYEGNFNKIIE